MAASNVIREYLVRLGFNFSTSSLNKAMSELNTAKNKATSIVTSISKNIGTSFTSISSAIVAANAAVAGFVVNIAKADLETQTAANRMYMNADAYRTMEQAATALGYSMNNLTDIALSPELTAQFKELVQLGQQTAAPVKLNEQLKEVRSILFEFNRLKVIVQNGMRQVASELLDILDEDLKRIKTNLNAFVNRIQDQLPKISRGIAGLLVHVLRAGNMLLNVIRFVGQLSNKVFEFLNKFPGAVKIAGAALIGIFIALNPVLAAATAGIGGLMVLIDDYMGYKQGANSFFGDKWKDFENIGREISESLGNVFTFAYQKAGPLFTFLLAEADNLFEFSSNRIVKIIDQVSPYIKSMFGTVLNTAKGILPFLLDAIGTLSKLLDQAILDLLPSLTDLFNTFVSTTGNLISKLAETIKPVAEELIPTLTEVLTQLIDGVFVPVIEGLGKIAETLIPILGDIAVKVGNTLNQTIMPILTRITDIVIPLIVDLVTFLGPYISNILDGVFFVINNIIGPIIIDLLDSISYVVEIFKQMGIDFDALMRPLFGLMGDASDGMLATFKEIVEIFEPILMPITKLAEIGEAAKRHGQKVRNFLGGRGFQTNEELGRTDEDRRAKNALTYKKYNTTPQADTTNIIPDLTSTTKYYGNIIANMPAVDLTSEDFKKYGLSEEINNYDNKRTTNTNNNRVTQNITVNNATMSNPFGAAANMANNIIKSMMLSPVTR